MRLLIVTLIIFSTLHPIYEVGSKTKGKAIMIKSAQQFVKIADKLKFPEGPAWDGKSALYLSNCYGDWITKIQEDSVTTFLTAADNPFTFKKTNGLTVYKDGSIFACDFGKGAILKISPDGKTTIYAAGYKKNRFNRPNDLAFDSKGNLYFTDPNKYDPDNRDGVIYRIETGTKKVTPVATNLAFPNGLAFSRDAKTLYVCESAMHRVLKFTVTNAGNLTDQKTLVELPGGDPDGLNIDEQGNLYVAHFGGGKIAVIKKDGTIKNILKTPGTKPSNVEFGDIDMKSLYITEDETNAVYKLRVDIPGLPLFCSPSLK